jgi:hypothetical protein
MFEIAKIKGCTYITCPNCEKQHTVSDDLCPVICHKCSEIIPDGNDILTSSTARTAYYNDSEYFK